MDFPISSQFYQFSSNLPAPINVGSTEQTKAGNLIIEGNLTTGGLQMPTGAGADKVLTTDSSGVASWQTPAGGSLWTQTGDDIYYNTGNVGIGISPTLAKLHVDGTISTKGSSIFAQSDNTSTAYGQAPIQLREAQYGATSGYLPPRLSFHWGGVVASQLTIESDGAIAVRNNPGTGYEKLRVATPTGASDAATKAYVDSKLASYAQCYTASAAATTLACNAGYTKVLSTEGSGCTLSTPTDITFSGLGTYNTFYTYGGGAFWATFENIQVGTGAGVITLQTVECYRECCTSACTGSCNRNSSVILCCQ